MRVAVYLYNYTPSKFILGGNSEELINLIISFFWKLSINYFSPLYYIKYYYFKIYECRVFIYISKNIKM